MLAGLAKAQSVGALAMALIEPVRNALDALGEGYRESELFATRAAFSVPEADPIDQPTRFFQTLGRLKTALTEGIGAIARSMREADKRDEADRAERLAWGLEELLGGRAVDDVIPFAHALDVWRDLAQASVQAHEPARKG